MNFMKLLIAVLALLDDLGNKLTKLIGTYEVILWRLVAVGIAIKHFLWK